jgi:hypothetical protein
MPSPDRLGSHPNNPANWDAANRASIPNNKQPEIPVFDFENNPYRARTTWPPDFARLPPSAKFAYERTFRRRSKLKWARPSWNKWLITAQNFAIAGTAVYALFYMDWTHDGKTDEPKVISSARNWWAGVGESWWTKVDRVEQGTAKEERG